MTQQIGAAITLTLVSCTGEPPTIESFCATATGSPEARAEQSRASVTSAVAILGHTDDEGYFCSGALVGPQTVLTAAHCVHGRDDFVFDVYSTADLLSEAPSVRARSRAEHPTQDLAALVLDGPLSPETLPLAWTSDLPRAERHRASFTGYGGPDDDISRCLRTSQQVSDLAPDPLDPSLERLAGLIDGRIYPGDSGGPIVVDDSGGPILLGILSQVTGWDTSRGSLGLFVRLQDDDPWLLDVVPTSPVPLP